MNTLPWILGVAGALIPLSVVAQSGPPVATVNVANTGSNPVPVTGIVESAHPRVSIVTFVSLQVGELFTETNDTSFYDVPLGKVLVIESVQYDTNAACSYRYIPTVRVDRPDQGGFRFDRYSLAVVSPTAFASSGGGAFMSADIHRVSINAPAMSAVKFGFSRNNGDCFGQIRFRVDGRLETAR